MVSVDVLGFSYYSGAVKYGRLYLYGECDVFLNDVFVLLHFYYIRVIMGGL